MPAYYAAVGLKLRNFNPSLCPLKLKINTAVIPVLGNIYTNNDQFQLLCVVYFELEPKSLYETNGLASLHCSLLKWPHKTVGLHFDFIIQCMVHLGHQM